MAALATGAQLYGSISDHKLVNSHLQGGVLRVTSYFTASVCALNHEVFLLSSGACMVVFLMSHVSQALI